MAEETGYVEASIYLLNFALDMYISCGFIILYSSSIYIWKETWILFKE